MGYFAYNAYAARKDLPRYLYAHMPQHFVWDSSGSQQVWRARKAGFAVGRMVGSISFEDLRTVDTVVYDTFKEACKAMGLLDDDREWIAAFNEAAVFATGRQLRNLLTVALVFGDVTEPHALWDHFKDSICGDLGRRIDRMENPPSLEDRHFDYGFYQTFAGHGMVQHPIIL
ncbi:hypothetical protein EYZ11_011032 [Aspergillus tanneri]|uniref:Uncharacterized protein n=1 Tax=Aspergillus tanneri TaxID=1220188 RepID=A0A4S3J604_9EURO|nr:hypothetical protein EYZ11_011032 [Aspergillus tanneri]